MSLPTSLQHYIQEPLIKMGRWALLPADTETWMTEETSLAFQHLFGLPKGILNICTLDDGFIQNYVPKAYAERLMQHVEEETKQDPTWLARILQTLYPLREEACRQIRTTEDLTALDNVTLIERYRQNRSWVHRLSAYDQFGWITERFWEPKLYEVLAQAGIRGDHSDFHRILFTLSKPEEPSTTMNERLAFLQTAQAIHEGLETVEIGAHTLTERFGWMPVFTYGTPWSIEHYQKELEREMTRPEHSRRETIASLLNYKAARAKDRADILQQLQWSKEDAQLFDNFALALDTRNEAEFFVSYAGFYLLPIYDEIAKRLELSVHDLRKLFEAEMVAALEGALDPKKCLAEKGGIVAWGFDENMQTRIDLHGTEAQTLFDAVEKNAAQMETRDEQKRGVCASPGQARGRARILHTPKDNDRVEEGDVLITVATTVDYLPAMQRAAAIVTEVGGLTCHAAVVSRELGIPCIVSYKHAMTIFKDGEWLDLNADKVPIIKAR